MVLEFIADAIPEVSEAISGALEGAGEFVGNIVNAIRNCATAIAPKVTEFAKNTIQYIKNAANSIVEHPVATAVSLGSIAVMTKGKQVVNLARLGVIAALIYLGYKWMNRR